MRQSRPQYKMHCKRQERYNIIREQITINEGYVCWYNLLTESQLMKQKLTETGREIEKSEILDKKFWYSSYINW